VFFQHHGTVIPVGWEKSLKLGICEGAMVRCLSNVCMYLFIYLLVFLRASRDTFKANLQFGLFSSFK